MSDDSAPASDNAAGLCTVMIVVTTLCLAGAFIMVGNFTKSAYGVSVWNLF